MLNEIITVQKHATLIYTPEEIEQAISKLALEINNSPVANCNPIVLVVMNGGLVVAGKLLEQLNFPLRLDVINASRYGENTRGSEVTWKQKPSLDLHGETLLLIDDILDEGLTLAAIKTYCQAQGAKEVYTAVLIDKTLEQVKPITADFIGLSIGDVYVYGSGMDYKGYLRNVAGIYACA